MRKVGRQYIENVATHVFGHTTIDALSVEECLEPRELYRRLSPRVLEKVKRQMSHESLGRILGYGSNERYTNDYRTTRLDDILPEIVGTYNISGSDLLAGLAIAVLVRYVCDIVFRRERHNHPEAMGDFDREMMKRR